MKKENLKKSLKAGIAALVMGTSSLMGGLCQEKSNAVKISSKNPDGTPVVELNFDITPDNPWFDEEGKAIVAKFQEDSSINGIWIDRDARLELRTAIAKMVADQIKAVIGPVNTWKEADDRKAKLFKILSLIYSECCRVYLRVGRDKKYENWITGDTPQDRLNLFWISWMVNNFMTWFRSLRFEPDKVDIDYDISNIPSCVSFLALSTPNSLCKFYMKGGFRAGCFIRPTIMNYLSNNLNFHYSNYSKYIDKLVNWSITDGSSSKKVYRLLNETVDDEIRLSFRTAIPKSLYPVVDPKYKDQKITVDQFLEGDLLNLSDGNVLVFEALDDISVPQKTMSISKPVVQRPQSKPAIRLQNKTNESKSKDFEVDYSKSYTLKFGRNGTPTLEEIK